VVYIDSFATQATSDALTLRDGQIDLSPVIATLSGTYTTLPGPYSSMTSNLYARFITNPTTNSAGFSISYKTTTTCEYLLRGSVAAGLCLNPALGLFNVNLWGYFFLPKHG
jgi:CUB domain